MVRILTNSDFLAHTNPLFHQTKILKIKDIHRYLLCIYMYSLKQGNDGMFDSVHEYHTRQGGDAQITYQRLTLTQHSLSFAAPQAWNSLPRRLRECDSYMLFKTQLKAHFVNAYASEG